MEAIYEKKIVSISPKRQITIPQKFFTKLQFGTEAECIMRGSEIVIKPASHVDEGEFSEYILEDLINEGYSGEKLLKEFKIRKAQVRPAVEAILRDADAIAAGQAEYMTLDDVIGDD